MHRIEFNLFDRAKQYFPSDRHELRTAARNHHYINREYQDWKSQLDLPNTYENPELELYYIAIITAFQHFESSLEFSQAIEDLLHEKRRNNMPAICILLRQSMESAFTASWLSSQSDIRSVAQRGFQITVRDLNNRYNFAAALQLHEPSFFHNRSINMKEIERQKLNLLLVGNQYGFNGKEIKEIFSPLITRLFKNIVIGGEKQNLSWIYMMLSAIGHGTWLGFYPSEKELTALIKLKDQCLRETLNRLKARTDKLIS